MYYYQQEIKWLTSLNYSMKVENLIPCLGYPLRPRGTTVPNFTYHAVSLECQGDTHTCRQRPDRLWSHHDQFTDVPRDDCSSRYTRTCPMISNVTFNQAITYRDWAVMWNLFNIDGKDSIVRNTWFLGLFMH